MLKESFYRTYEELKHKNIVTIGEFLCDTFLSYLWGIETSAPLAISPSKFVVFIVPMRNWNTSTENLLANKNASFLSYLWGIETCSKLGFQGYDIVVFIVPMRNWNLLFRCRNIRQWKSFYRTYEELKHLIVNFGWRIGLQFLSYLWGIETLRNSVILKSKCTAFLSYLWGIETWREGVIW